MTPCIWQSCLIILFRTSRSLMFPTSQLPRPWPMVSSTASAQYSSLSLTYSPMGPIGLRKLLRALAHQVHQLAQFLRAVLPGELVQELAFVRAVASLAAWTPCHAASRFRPSRPSPPNAARLLVAVRYAACVSVRATISSWRALSSASFAVCASTARCSESSCACDCCCSAARACSMASSSSFLDPCCPRDLVRVRHRVGLRALLAQERRLLLVRGADVRDQGGGFSLELGQALLRLVHLRLAVRDRLRLVADVRLQRRP